MVAGIQCEGAAGEAAHVGLELARGRFVVRVGSHIHGPGTVVEGAVLGGDDAAGGGVVCIIGRTCADAAQRVLDEGPVAQHHGALVGGGLVQIAVALHEDALPHLARAG